MVTFGIIHTQMQERGEPYVDENGMQGWRVDIGEIVAARSHLIQAHLGYAARNFAGYSVAYPAIPDPKIGISHDRIIETITFEPVDSRQGSQRTLMTITNRDLRCTQSDRPSGAKFNLPKTKYLRTGEERQRVLDFIAVALGTNRAGR